MTQLLSCTELTTVAIKWLQLVASCFFAHFVCQVITFLVLLQDS